MKQNISLEKMSKKAQKEYYVKQRGSWYGISPVTRIVKSVKGYDRNRIKQAARRAGGSEV